MPVVAVTASSLIDEESDLRAQFSGYLRKPFSRAELYQEISQFIPRVEPVAEADCPTSQPGPAPRMVSEAGPLARKLKDLEREIWARLRESPGLLETKQFASKLAELALQHSSDALAEYASQLHHATETFSFSEIEHALTAIPALVEAHQLSLYEPCPEI